MKKNDFILLGGLLLTALLLFAGYFFLYHQTGEFVTVTVDGKLLETLPLDTDKTLTIPGAQGGNNVLVIQDGYANIIDADCPDKLCVHQKKINKQGQTLVCLPHKVVVQVQSDSKVTLDGVAH